MALIPVAQRVVIFYDDELTAVVVDSVSGRTVYVPIRPICEFMGVNWDGQRRRIGRDAVLNDELQGVVVTTTPSSDGRGGGPQEMSCLPLKFIPGWLFGINASRVKPELRDKIIRYQRECYEVLAQAFKEGQLTSDPAFADLLKTDTPAVRAYKTILAVSELARQQVLMESQLREYAQRLETVESVLADTGRSITPAEAAQISQAVKAIAMEMSRQSGRNEYGGVYGELYRRFGITSYKLLPSVRFGEAMQFLTDWYMGITGDENMPF